MGYRTNAADVLLDLEVAAAAVGRLNLLVPVPAISVNPVDSKVRAFEAPPVGGPRTEVRSPRPTSRPRTGTWRPAGPSARRC